MRPGASFFRMRTGRCEEVFYGTGAVLSIKIEELGAKNFPLKLVLLAVEGVQLKIKDPIKTIKTL